MGDSPEKAHEQRTQPVPMDLSNWKRDPRVWLAVLALFGFTNFGEFVNWVRGGFGIGTPAELRRDLAQETVARKSADSAIFLKIDTVSTQVDTVVRQNKSLGADLKLTQNYLLRVREVAEYDRERVKRDSIRREKARELERRRQEVFERDRESRGFMPFERGLN